MSAKRASAQAAQVLKLQYTDWYPLVKAKFYEKWTNGWRLRPSKFRDVHDAPGIWDEIHVTRRREVIMNRLSCGHTKLTHGYFMNSNVLESHPVYPACQNLTLTIQHLLLDCRELQSIRRQCFSVCRRQNDPTIADMIGPGCKTSEVIYFLRMVHAYDLIDFKMTTRMG